MQKFIIILIILSSLLYAKFNPTKFPTMVDESKIDIYFGNGVWNDPEGAEEGKKGLDRKIEKYIIGNNTIFSKRYGDVLLSYNWGRGYMEDVLETYYQLREAAV